MPQRLEAWSAAETRCLRKGIVCKRPSALQSPRETWKLSRRSGRHRRLVPARRSSSTAGRSWGSMSVSHRNGTAPSRWRRALAGCNGSRRTQAPHVHPQRRCFCFCGIRDCPQHLRALIPDAHLTSPDSCVRSCAAISFREPRVRPASTGHGRGLCRCTASFVRRSLVLFVMLGKEVMFVSIVLFEIRSLSCIMYGARAAQVPRRSWGFPRRAGMRRHCSSSCGPARLPLAGPARSRKDRLR